MGLDKQPAPPPKRVREDGGGQDVRISSTVPPDAQRAMKRADEAISESSRLEAAETPVREERAAVEKRARDGERQTQLTPAEMLQRCDSPWLPPQPMRKTLKQMTKALQMMMAHEERCPHPLKVRLKRDTPLTPKMTGTMASNKFHFLTSTQFGL